jgi:hypothetical protein
MRRGKVFDERRKKFFLVRGQAVKSSRKYCRHPASVKPRLMRRLWHGNVYNALRRLDTLDFDFACYDGNEEEIVKKVWQAVHEFQRYITVNQKYIPNYGERYRYGETISTAFVESTVNEVISRRMVKKQQMRWTKRGAHLLLQVREQTLSGDLKALFRRWYPEMVAAGTEREAPPLAV